MMTQTELKLKKAGIPEFVGYKQLTELLNYKIATIRWMAVRGKYSFPQPVERGFITRSALANWLDRPTHRRFLRHEL